MRSHLRLLACALAAVAFGAISGCNTRINTTHLNTPGSQARPLFPAIRACATQRGLTFVDHPDSVDVQIETSVWDQYTIQSSGAFDLVTVIDENVVPKDQVEGKVALGRDKGQEIYNCALAGGAQPVQVAPPAPTNDPNNGKIHP